MRDPPGTPGAGHERAVQRKIDGMRDDSLARLRTREHGRGPRAAGTEEAATQPDLELAAPVAANTFEARAAAVRPSQHPTDSGAPAGPHWPVDGRCQLAR